MAVSPLPKPNVHGDSGVWGVTLNTALDTVATAIDTMDAATVKISQYPDGATAAGGIATVGGDGTVEQPPHAHSHSIIVQDSGSTTFYTAGHLDMYFGSGNVVYDAANDRIKILASPPDVRTLRLANDVTVNNTTTLSSSIADLQLNLDATTDSFDFDALLFFSSTAAALIKIGLQVSGTSPTLLALLTGPTEAQNVNSGGGSDAVTLRTAVYQVTNAGPQHFGGFPSSGSGTSWCRIQGFVKAGSTTGNMNLKIAQVTATAVDTKLLAGSKMFVNRVS